MGKAEAFALFPTCQEKSTHGGCLADTDGRDGSLDVAHCIINSHTRRNYPAGRIYVEMNILVGVFSLQKKKLGNDQVGNLIVNPTAEKNDPIFEKPRINVVGPFAPAGLFDNYGYKHNTSGKSVSSKCQTVITGKGNLSKNGVYFCTLSPGTSVTLARATRKSIALSSRIWAMRFSLAFSFCR